MGASVENRERVGKKPFLHPISPCIIFFSPEGAVSVSIKKKGHRDLFFATFSHKACQASRNYIIVQDIKVTRYNVKFFRSIPP